MLASCAGSICSGRPETTITVHDFASLQTLSTAALSASLSFIVCAGREHAVVARVEAPARAADVAEALGVRRLADHHDAVVAAPDRRARRPG